MKRWPRLVKAGLLEAKWCKRCPGWLSCPQRPEKLEKACACPLPLGDLPGSSCCQERQLEQRSRRTGERHRAGRRMPQRLDGSAKLRAGSHLFFFSFLLGLFVLKTLVTSNSKVILKTYWALCGNRCPQFWFSFPLFHLPYPTNPGSRIHNPNFMSHFVCHLIQWAPHLVLSRESPFPVGRLTVAVPTQVIVHRRTLLFTVSLGHSISSDS